ESKEEADKVVKRLAFLFGLPVKFGNSGSFAGTIVEVLNSKGRGANGHIAIRTNYIERAINYMSTVLGVEFYEPIMKNDKINAIYMKEEIGGFAIHLLQK
ncbi:MAG: keto-hydroxyglutarate-aldolase/keto-deoxy-phosphogluconate aldolase, partial [Lachnospiraceae bacterium]|nr:keto-hydroxyglutarate-aldolase/keto-deoxy-phosphogluconate aldolase [Lachnospiraceae bacterium]